LFVWAIIEFTGLVYSQIKKQEMWKGSTRKGDVLDSIIISVQVAEGYKKFAGEQERSIAG
jgi:hypothetical protein